jgi:flagellar L-ring protein precursor FlgH
MNLVGCAAGLKQTEPLKEDVVYEVNDKGPQEKYEGSLWQDDSPFCDLFINPKARRVGDIITVNILESSTASNNATTDTDRKSTLYGTIEKMLGYERQFSEPKHQFNPFGGIKGGLESEFAGAGTTKRSGNLAASITARVTEILPNSNLKIFGSREVTVNNEKQFITLSGIIRSRDISPDNAILSTYISDAKIVYSGAGIIDDRQHPGWLARVVDKAWPF